MKQKNLKKEEFIEKYCNLCGTQRCEGIDSIWFKGCEYKDYYEGDKNET